MFDISAMKSDEAKTKVRRPYDKRVLTETAWIWYDAH